MADKILKADTVGEMVGKINAHMEDYVQQHDFKLENMIINGDFSQGTSGWIGTGGILNVEDNVAKIKSDGLTQTSRIEYLAKITSNGSDLFYYGFNIKKENSGRVEIFTGSIAILEADIQPNTWVWASGVDQISESLYRLYFYVDRQNYTVQQTVEYSNIQLLNLTQIFGSGEEPTKEEMDLLIDILGGWWDGEITPTQKQLTRWYLAMIRQLKNAQIAGGGSSV